MKHMTWGAVALLGVTALAGCYSYPSDAINNNNYHTVQATPNFETIRLGDSDQVIVRLINDANNGAITSYAISNVGSGIQVHYQANYRPVYDATKDTLVPQVDKNAQEYYVVGTAIGRYTYTITPTSVNTGVSATINVLVTPRNLPAALSKHTAVPGDTVVITAPAGLVFSQASAVTFPTGSAVTVVGRAADSSSITIVVGGGITGPASVTLVSQPIASVTPPTTLVTTDSLVSTPFPAPIPVTVNANSFPFGGTLIVTLGGGLRFNANDTIKVGQAAGTNFKILTTDSTQASVTVPAGQSDSLFIANVYFAAYHPSPAATSAGLFSGKASAVVTTTAAPTSAPTTLSSATGPASTTFTATIGGGVLRFSKASTITVGGVVAPIQSFSADSLSATALILLNATGPVAYTGLVSVVNPGLTIAVPSDGKTFTATAPTALVVTAGATDVVGSGFTACTAGAAAIGGKACHYYTITVAAGTIASSITWTTTGANQDMGVFLFDAAGANCKYTLADNNGPTSGTTGDSQTFPVDCAEDPAAVTLVAGTYTLVVLDFTSATAFPTSFHVHTQQ